MIDPETIKKEMQILDKIIEEERIELKSLEFKRDLPEEQKEKKIKFLAEISSLANTYGGDLYIGIDQKKGSGKPVKKGVPSANTDNDIQRIENMFRDDFDPRIIGIVIVPIPIDESKVILKISVPQSRIGPHMVKFKEHCKFYARNSNGKYRLDVDELRVAFNLSSTIEKRIKDFQWERVVKISVNETPVPFDEDSKVIFHFIPLSAFSSRISYDLTDFSAYPDRLQPVKANGWHCCFNLEGVISYFPTEGESLSHTYVQLYRNGIIESVTAGIFGRTSPKTIYSEGIEEDSVCAVRYFLSLLKQLKVDPNITFFMSLTNVKDYRMPSGIYNQFPGEIHSIDRDIIYFPEILITDFDVNPEELLKDNFDLLWNACGFPRSPHYKDGKWTLGKK